MVNVATDNIHDLLILQDRFAAVQQLKTEIQRLPLEIEKLQQKIKEELDTLDGQRQELRDHELQRKNLELEVETAQTQITKYKNQQLQVKKNEEYQALTHEIERFEQRISDLETEVLEVMERMDVVREKLKEQEQACNKRITYHEAMIAECREKLKQLEARLGDAEGTYETQAESMDEERIQLFQILVQQVKRPPYLTSITGQNCGGCHMRVSNDVLKQARMGELVKCDQCGRVLYIES